MSSESDTRWPAPNCPGTPLADGVLDLRVDGTRESAPEPLHHGDARAFLERLGAGASFRASFEQLLRELPAERGDRLTQLRKESRGAWFPLLAASGGSALVIGNSATGTVVPLAAFGFHVTLLDPSPERLRFALVAAAEQVPGRLRGFVGGEGEALPFHDQSFDLVVVEDVLGAAFPLSEALRVTRGELWAIADNRLGYKRSSGRYGDFRVPGPVEYLRAILRPPRGERTLAGYRRMLSAPDFAPPRAFALYAHRRDFAQVVALDEPQPSLAVGPSERRNRLKLAARAAGLFPVFTPSFAFHCARPELAARPRRIEGLLRELAQRIDEPQPDLEHLIGTRGNTIVALTSLREEGPPSAAASAGRWALHVPMQQGHRGGLELHLDSLRRVRADFPAVPVPAALFLGECAGVWLTCERRLGGMAAHHWTRDAARADRLLVDVAGHFAELLVAPPAPFDTAAFEAELEPRFELLLRHIPEADTRRSLVAARERARRELVGRSFPRVYAHGDLRPKHVQLDAAGRVLGYLDWGTAAVSDLPGFDLMHLALHLRKQLDGVREGAGWRALLEPARRRPGEARAFALYRERLGFDAATADALAELHPVIVGHTAERNWPHSRPGWLRRHFGL